MIEGDRSSTNVCTRPCCRRQRQTDGIKPPHSILISLAQTRHERSRIALCSISLRRIQFPVLNIHRGDDKAAMVVYKKTKDAHLSDHQMLAPCGESHA